ncbi:MAG: sialidase family protein [Acidobacteriota bacterium]
MRTPFLTAILLLLLACAALTTALAGSIEDAEPRTALERLVAENQDFSRLEPGELRDGLPVPAWLRVLWRRDHPDGPYPLLLKEVHEWMLAHPDLVPPEEPEPIPVPARRKARIGANRRVSGPWPDPINESDVQIDRWNPKRILVASNDIKGSGRLAVFYSKDGGATWGRSFLPFVENDSIHADPTVDWSSDGTAWATTAAVEVTPLALRLRVYRSSDGGATWKLDDTPSGAQGRVDKQMTWMDHSRTSPYRDTFYAIWRDRNGVFMNRRVPGKGWAAMPVQVNGPESVDGLGCDVTTNAKGHVFALWPEPENRKILFIQSKNGGATWTAPRSIGSTWGIYQMIVPAVAERKMLIYLSAGAYVRGKKSLIYAAWADLSGAPGCRVREDAPGENVASACKTRIWFLRSADGGSTWSAPRKVNDPAAKSDQFAPALAVDETTGALALIYYDTVADPGRKKTHVYYQASYDDGVTWTKPLRVTTQPTDETREGSDARQYGDYNGLSGYAGQFFPTWTDRRASSPEEIWTATVRDIR